MRDRGEMKAYEKEKKHMFKRKTAGNVKYFDRLDKLAKFTTCVFGECGQGKSTALTKIAELFL